MAVFSGKSHLPMVPFLQPVWGIREHIYETVVDTIDDPYRQGFRFFAFGGAALSASGAAVRGGPGAMLFAFMALGFVAYVFSLLVEPIIVKKHESKLPDVALTIHMYVVSLVLKAVVGLQLFVVMSSMVALNFPAALGDMLALGMFQVAVTIVLDDGSRPERTAQVHT